MKKLILAAVVSAFAFTSFAASACDRDIPQKGSENTQAKKDAKKSNEATKSDQKKS